MQQMHEEVKYLFGQCDKEFCQREYFAEHQSAHAAVSTSAHNPTIKQLQKKILLSTKGQYMKESNTIADNAAIHLLQKEILRDTKWQYMMESNTLADNVVKAK